MKKSNKIVSINKPYSFHNTEVLYLNGIVSMDMQKDFCKRVTEINQENIKNKLDNEFQEELNKVKALNESASSAEKKMTIAEPVKPLKIVEEIIVHITSPGGYTTAMKGIINAIKTSEVPVTTFVTGDIASAASSIFLAAKKRIMHQDASIMIHDVAYGDYGKHNEIKDNREYHDNYAAILKAYILKHTTIPESEYNKRIEVAKQDWSMFYEEAGKYNLYTHLLID